MGAVRFRQGWVVLVLVVRVFRRRVAISADRVERSVARLRHGCRLEFGIVRKFPFMYVIRGKEK